MSSPGATADTRAQPAGRRDSYYGQPVIKEPTWTPEIPWYFFFGGLAGASGTFALFTGRRHPMLARRAWLTSMAALTISPALLISDLGRPARFLNMLRMFKVTSPMSVGSWILVGAGSTIGPSGLHPLTGLVPRLAPRTRPAPAVLGFPPAPPPRPATAHPALPPQ